MSVDLIQQLLGGNQGEYADFLRRFQADPNSISEEEASRRYRELMSKLPPEAAAQAHAQVLAQFSPDDRRRIAAQFQGANNDPRRPFHGFDADDLDQAAEPRTLGVMSQRASAQDPDLFGQIFGQGQESPLGGQLGKLLMSALVAYLAQRMLGGGQPNVREAPGGQYGGGPFDSPGAGGMGGGLGDLLGGLLGGQGGAQTGMGGGLGEILGGLLGGRAAGAQGGAPAGSLDDLLGGLLGGQGGAQGGAQGGPAADDDDTSPSRSHRKYI
jgi:hypothetical protein